MEKTDDEMIFGQDKNYGDGTKMSNIPSKPNWNETSILKP